MLADCGELASNRFLLGLGLAARFGIPTSRTNQQCFPGAKMNEMSLHGIRARNDPGALSNMAMNVNREPSQKVDMNHHLNDVQQRAPK